MKNYADKTQENQSQSVANVDTQKQGGGDSTFQFVDNSPEAIAQRKLQEMADNSPEAKKNAQLQAMADNSPEAKEAAQLQAMADNSSEAKETAQLQAMVDNSPEAKATAQLQATADNHSAEEEQATPKQKNNTGLPDKLKAGIENLSGYSMDDVKVHRNSDKPAQLQAHAYAQGTDIHLGPGQEKHLPHEAWHVAQQKDGRVKPTMQMKGDVNVNDDDGLEKEADVMGAKALQFVAPVGEQKTNKNKVKPISLGTAQLSKFRYVNTKWPFWEVVDAKKDEPVPEFVPNIKKLGKVYDTVTKEYTFFTEAENVQNEDEEEEEVVFVKFDIQPMKRNKFKRELIAMGMLDNGEDSNHHRIMQDPLTKKTTSLSLGGHGDSCLQNVKTLKIYLKQLGVSASEWNKR